MRFGGLRAGADDQERILETFLVQNGGLLKHRDRTRGQEELLPQVERDGRLYTLRLGEGEGKGWEVSTEFSHVKEGLQGSWGRPCPYGLINVFRSGINVKIVGRFLVGC